MWMFALRIIINTQNMQANTKFLNVKSGGIYKNCGDLNGYECKLIF
jgi:hypothetical protein